MPFLIVLFINIIVLFYSHKGEVKGDINGFGAIVYWQV